MQLNVEQRKLVQSKPAGHSLIRGVAGSGKTTVAVNRIPFLLENYCFDKDDKILMVTYNKSLISYIKYIYDKVEKDREYEIISLFEIDKSKLEIKNIDALMYRYFMEYCKSNNLQLQVESRQAIISSIIIKAIYDAKQYYSDVKIIEQSNLNFISEEIGWIKACRYLDVEEYQSADRIGRMSNHDGPQKLQKNSKTRSAIYKIMQLYDISMRANKKVDFNDVSLLALEQIKKKPIKKYTHIISDESQDLTRVQLEFIYELMNNKNYSSTMFVSDNAQSIYPQSWLVKGRSFLSVGFDVKGRSNSLAKNYRTTTQIAQAAYSLLDKDPLITEDENYVKPSLLDKQGVYPVFRTFADKPLEANYVTSLISKLSKNYEYGDIAIIARTNGQIKELSTYLETANVPFKLMTKQDGYEFGDDKVKILTMHSIKGLEFKVVIMIGLNSKSIPLKSISMDDDGTFEMRERKLMYVGMTRATERLYLTADGTPSKFISDINPKFLKHDENTLMSNFYSLTQENFSFKEKLTDVYSAEEKVRQWIINELKENYKYPEKLLDVEYQVNNFSKIGYVDVVVSIYKNNTKTPYIFIEVKRQCTGIINCLEQLKSYMSTTLTCKYGLATDGVDLLFINSDLEVIDDIPSFKASMLPSSLENYCYVDLRNNVNHKFMRDYNNISELIFENEEVSELKDMKKLNVFSGIAAGDPILLNSTVDEQFYIPQIWTQKNSTNYMIKVKGDSMINANINDGDLVVIRQQNTANNYEIVAVDLDGNTTLKRFVKMGDTILLMPENPSYEPINVTETQMSILGVAVGVVKSINI
ncbi:transcriptional repressor LexA [Clostridium estertheticum]|uniref:transcriptional repressor LexA n=1 Tax=Clostridium estertheticum TaxID=238834 RepID=UPI001C7DDC4D|nr:transcriptional repressor LexA [Clostridium estertheticum]MBX4271087.1 transcriptional repressor LexA [Clostridium estertheticum]WLC78321.1 transcriptional repressor LexA [Clostridium estertheticum]